MTTNTESNVLDVRGLRKPDKHPTIFAAFNALKVGESMTLVNDHDPKHLHDEFTRDHGEGFGWDYLQQETRDWRIQITKLASTPLPRIVADSTDPGEAVGVDHTSWGLNTGTRDLDASIVILPADEEIEGYVGPDFDILIHVTAGSGTLATEVGEVALATGAIAWVPARSTRGFAAGRDGLTYLAVSKRRQDALRLL